MSPGRLVLSCTTAGRNGLEEPAVLAHLAGDQYETGARRRVRNVLGELRLCGCIHLLDVGHNHKTTLGGKRQRVCRRDHIPGVCGLTVERLVIEREIGGFGDAVAEPVERALQQQLFLSVDEVDRLEIL